jgi:hypothetical protein
MIRGKVEAWTGYQTNFHDGVTVDLPRRWVMKRLRKAPEVGDLMWLQEPWAEYEPKGMTDYDIVVGHFLIAQVPEKYRHRNVKTTFHLPSTLPRSYSRATLEAVKWANDGSHLRVRIHMQQIDKFCRERGIKI